MNIGHSSRLPYDVNTYNDKVGESIQSVVYRLSQDQIYNSNGCLSVFGARSVNNGRGNDVSRPIETGPAASQDLIDVDSMLSNRNVKNSKSRTGKVNPVLISDYKLKNSTICNNTLNTESSRLNFPASNYRDMSINRFFNLQKDPQANIYWDNAANTKLEAIDNYSLVQAKPWKEGILPVPTNNSPVTCNSTVTCIPKV